MPDSPNGKFNVYMECKVVVSLVYGGSWHDAKCPMIELAYIIHQADTDL